ncbi:hypothetical protein AKJ16_DCAP16476 [Drosera capensis]
MGEIDRDEKPTVSHRKSIWREIWPIWCLALAREDDCAGCVVVFCGSLMAASKKPAVQSPVSIKAVSTKPAVQNLQRKSWIVNGRLGGRGDTNVKWICGMRQGSQCQKDTNECWAIQIADTFSDHLVSVEKQPRGKRALKEHYGKYIGKKGKCKIGLSDSAKIKFIRMNDKQVWEENKVIASLEVRKPVLGVLELYQSLREWFKREDFYSGPIEADKKAYQLHVVKILSQKKEGKERTKDKRKLDNVV